MTNFEILRSGFCSVADDGRSIKINFKSPADRLGAFDALMALMNAELKRTESASFHDEKSFDDACVDAFAEAMKAKLDKKREQGLSGWSNKGICSRSHLSSLLHGHVAKGDPLDVANLAMFLHHRQERIDTPIDKSGVIDSEIVNAVHDLWVDEQ